MIANASLVPAERIQNRICLVRGQKVLLDRFSNSVLGSFEQGVAMRSSVLHSSRAFQVNIEIMRAFVRLRQLLGSSVDLARKLAPRERKYDRKFKIVFDAIRELMTERAPLRSAADREIGFHAIPRLKAPGLKAKKF